MPTPTSAPPIPAYLRDTYAWAYVTPEAVRRFERPWLVNLILWGNYARLRTLALDAFGTALTGNSLQIGCVYGDLTSRWQTRHAPDGRLDVVDVLPVQLDNLRRKLGADSSAAANVCLHLADSASLPFADTSHDRVLLFFLLHEQPADVRRATVREAWRVLRPGGKLVVVDYHRPSRLHPLRLLMRFILGVLEPYALDLWRREIADWLPEDMPLASIRKQTFFGGLYQMIEVKR